MTERYFLQYLQCVYCTPGLYTYPDVQYFLQDVDSKVLAGQVTRVIRDPNNTDKDLYCGTITADPTKPGM